ncbi:hypothetical protein [Pantoea phage LIMEzero]|uniref:Uncharacterized protein n=1 Tax=Pantoea phage LIMEzero TaxID=943335 RepID=F4N9R8_9CAUD|nr:hypothetical protein LIMEzero_ORF15 [Pantoea phage LIMEzero]CBY88546.1 hypothetical protein [Pantoea phage LIMEzero]
MSIDFANISPGAIEYNRKILARMKSPEYGGMPTTIQFRGGFTQLEAYEAWMNQDQRGQLVVFATQFGVTVSAYVEVWCNVNATHALHQFGKDSPAYAEALRQITVLGNTACKALASEQALDAYALWTKGNRNVPTDMAEDELHLAYAAELLTIANEMMEFEHEKPTLH